MKNVATLIFGLAAMLILASCFIGGDEKTTVINELKNEGWTDIMVQPTEEEDGTYYFHAETEACFGKTIMVEGTLAYDQTGIEPVVMTAYGVDDEGTMLVIGTWDPLNDWIYTEYGSAYLREVRHYTT